LETVAVLVIACGGVRAVINPLVGGKLIPKKTTFRPKRGMGTPRCTGLLIGLEFVDDLIANTQNVFNGNQMFQYFEEMEKLFAEAIALSQLIKLDIVRISKIPKDFFFFTIDKEIRTILTAAEGKFGNIIEH